MKSKQYYVYIMTTERNMALYIGVTNDLLRRVYEHRNGLVSGFIKKYQVHKLVYYETGRDVAEAIAREKQLKSWRRDKKLALIDGFNPDWRDLYDRIDQTGKIAVE